MKEYTTHSAEETEAVGYAFAQTLRAGDFVAMFGDLGVGKTAFVRGAARFLAPNARVQSPTYTVVNEYPAATPVYHFDLYRITDPDSLYAIGFYDYTDGKAICFAEWSENIIEDLPADRVTVRIEKTDDPDTRRILIERKETV